MEDSESYARYFGLSVLLRTGRLGVRPSSGAPCDKKISSFRLLIFCFVLLILPEAVLTEGVARDRHNEDSVKHLRGLALLANVVSVLVGRS